MGLSNCVDDQIHAHAQTSAKHVAYTGLARAKERDGGGVNLNVKQANANN